MNFGLRNDAMIEAGRDTEAVPESPPAQSHALLKYLFASPLLLALFAGAYYLALLAVPGLDEFHAIKGAYQFATLFMPAWLTGVGLFALGLARRAQDRHSRPSRAIIVCFALAILLIVTRIYATHVEPYRLQVRTVVIETPKLKAPLRILHISDLQASAIGAYERRAFDAMRSLKPDLVIHTGDLLQPIRPATLASELPRLGDLFKTLTPPLGKLNVFGDIDFELARPLRAGLGDLETLESREKIIDTPAGRLRVWGLTLEGSIGSPAVLAEVERWLAQADPADFTILLGHRPDYILAVKDLPLDLCLAGHTHGGQIRLPWFGPLKTLSRVPRAWALGFHQTGRTRINVTAGVGSEHIFEIPAIRLNCPPEMTLIELRPSRAGK